MLISTKTFSSALLALGLAAVGASASAQATVSTQLLSGDALTSGSTLVVRVAVTANTSGFIPSGANFRMRWPDAKVQFVGATGFSGSLGVGPVQFSPADEDDVTTDGLVFRDFATLGPNPFPGTNPTPNCFDVTFLVLGTPALPYAITVETDPGNPNPPPSWQPSPLPYFVLTPIPAAGTIPAASITYNNSATTFTDTTAPTSSATIAAATKVGGAIDGTYTASDASGIASVDLYVRRSDGSWALVGPVTGGTFNYTPASSGVYYFQTVATDNATNVETIPTGSTGTGDDVVVYNSAANAPIALDVAADGTYVFPLKDGLLVSITFTGVTGSGAVTVGRTEGDSAPAGYLASLLIDQKLSITAGGTLAFTSAVVTVDYEETLLGGVAEGAITTAFRDVSGTVTSVAASVNSGANTLTFTTAGFSEWYFGEANASTQDWTTIGE